MKGLKAHKDMKLLVRGFTAICMFLKKSLEKTKQKNKKNADSYL